MSYRIKELIYECTTSSIEEVYDGRDSYLDQVEYFDKEKFAELIVRECCDMANKHTQHNNPNDCLLVLNIKEHFGIED